MEKWMLLGWRHVEGTSKNTGNPYKGTSIYACRETNGVTGQEETPLLMLEQGASCR